MRTEQLGWGARKIKHVLEREGSTDIPSERTVGNILLRSGAISPDESRKHQAFKRFEREHCNELWQADFKGEFKTGDGRRRRKRSTASPAGVGAGAEGDVGTPALGLPCGERGLCPQRPPDARTHPAF